jgi:hypothetical protein
MNRMYRVAIALASLSVMFASGTARAQQGTEAPEPVAKRADVYCTGFIADAPPRIDLQVIGGEKEHMKLTFAQGDVVFLNKGRQQGINSGAVYYIIRPLGPVKHPFTKKRLGHYVREIGMLRVIEVGDKASTAEILVSCDMVEFGDLLKPYEEYVPPGAREARPLARYGEGSNDNIGQIVMARDYHENLSANQVVYLDLGDRQNVRPGDYFTIYRETGESEGFTKTPKYNVVKKRSKGFESDRYHGGEFSIESRRETQSKVFKSRPPIPRKVVGELVVVKVEKNTSVAIITRTTSEVNIGDYVERSK